MHKVSLGDGMYVTLTDKERRTFAYLAIRNAFGIETTIGDICNDLNTGVDTLLGKTLPSLEEKMDRAGFKFSFRLHPEEY